MAENPDVDEPDGNCMRKSKEETDDEISEESPPAYREHYGIQSSEKYSVYYNMNHVYRGYALIFNHKFFKKGETIMGAIEDCEDLTRCLEELGFMVHVFQDLRKYEIENKIEEATQWDHQHCDCFLIAVLSHGDVEAINASDVVYKPQHIWSRFTPDKCPSLAGKPKIFIFEVGRGRNVDRGFTLLERRTEFDNISTSYKIPLEADFLFAYSTPEGYVSWRDSDDRSWFINALCVELKHRAYTDHLQAILTYVNQRVALEYESVYPQEASRHRSKQAPCFLSTFTRFLKFTPKAVESTNTYSKHDSNNNNN